VIHKIKALYDNGNGLSQRKIALELGLSRNSVRKYLALSEEAISEQQSASARTKQLDAHEAYIVHLLKRYPNLSAVKVLRKLQEKHGPIGASNRTVRRYVEKLKATVNSKPARVYQPVLDMVPGVQCQVDGGELRGVLIGGKETTVYFVVFVLSYSRLMYVGLSPSPINTDTFIGMHDAAFRYFGGCSEECVYDQTKLVVLQEEYRELTLNQRFHEYATHAGFRIHACEGYDPESKGKVEAGVKYVKHNALYGEQFASWSELVGYMANWLDTVANQRCHGSTGKIPQAHYDEAERAHMRPYHTPSVVHQNGQPGVTRKADKTGLIAWQANKYSVPMAYQGAKVRVMDSESELIIYDLYTGDELARHALCHDKGKVIQNRHHYRDLAQTVNDLEAAISEQIGDTHGKQLCALLQASSPKIYKDQLRGVKQLLASSGPLDTAILDTLCQRPRLTATGVKEWLAALTQQRKRQQPTYSAEPLQNYAKLTEVNHVIH